jgi:hypothetical protein
VLYIHRCQDSPTIAPCPAPPETDRLILICAYNLFGKSQFECFVKTTATLTKKQEKSVDNLHFSVDSLRTPHMLAASH